MRISGVPAPIGQNVARNNNERERDRGLGVGTVPVRPRVEAETGWWGIVDSNHGPQSYQDCALTT